MTTMSFAGSLEVAWQTWQCVQVPITRSLCLGMWASLYAGPTLLEIIMVEYGMCSFFPGYCNGLASQYSIGSLISASIAFVQSAYVQK